jgi:hypothetical protein
MEIKGAYNVMNHYFTSSFGHDTKLVKGKMRWKWIAKLKAYGVTKEVI